MASEDMQIVNDCCTTHIKQILPQAPIPSTAALPAPHMRQGVLHGHTLPQFPEQLLIGMNRDATPLCTPGAPHLEGTGRTDRCREVDHAARLERAGHEIKFTEQEQTKIQALMRKFEANPYSTPSVKDSQADVGEEVLNTLIELEELIAVSSDVIFRKQHYEKMTARIQAVLAQNGRISLAEVRDLFDTSRKYAQALLEHLDELGITVREGDYRRLRTS